ncbi:MAG TPA: glycosyl hydrolase, partial [Planctomycetota bacterium]|nr:glycosyl hydrolase [Planctomycetota bacterium]
TSAWPRTSVAGKPAVFRTTNAGRTWQRQDRGLPKQGWLTVKRQAFCADGEKAVGLYLGSTSGTIWHSRDEGRTWKILAEHLPHLFSLTIAASR